MTFDRRLLLWPCFVLAARGAWASSYVDCPASLANTTVELSETEAKYLVPKLEFAEDVTNALFSGRVTTRVPQRGFVLQEYIPPTLENLRLVFALMNDVGVPFGTTADQAAFLEIGIAKEIRLMSGSIRRIDGRHATRQITIKGAGGGAIAQIESPRDVGPAKVRDLGAVFERLRPLVVGSARKMYFEIAEPDGQVTEIDIFLGRAGIGAPPIFINGEIEFHGARALTEAEAYRASSVRRPPYLGVDLTDAAGVKSRDIALVGPPAQIAERLAVHRARNLEFTERLAREFVGWADAYLVRRILWPKRSVGERLRAFGSKLSEVSSWFSSH